MLRVMRILFLVLVLPALCTPAGAATAADSAAPSESPQTIALRTRLFSFRNWTQGVTLSFLPQKAYAVPRTAAMLRLKGCSYDVEGDVTSLIKLLLGHGLHVGDPPGSQDYRPEAGFGVYFGPDAANGLDLWFSNALTFDSDTRLVVGQSQDRGVATSYPIAAGPTLREELWSWAHAHGHPRPGTLETCRDMDHN